VVFFNPVFNLGKGVTNVVGRVTLLLERFDAAREEIIAICFLVLTRMQQTLPERGKL
jgi:hypothetical protein